MCIRAQFAPLDSLVPWDSAQQLITIPDELHVQEYAIRAIRAVLAELAIPQDPLGARCWCGDQIRFLPRVPEQRRNGEVVNRGV